eukprot:453417-Prorocentrum_minimum.AAC.1
MITIGAGRAGRAVFAAAPVAVRQRSKRVRLLRPLADGAPRRRTGDPRPGGRQLRHHQRAGDGEPRRHGRGDGEPREPREGVRGRGRLRRRRRSGWSGG